MKLSYRFLCVLVASTILVTYYMWPKELKIFGEETTVSKVTSDLTNQNNFPAKTIPSVKLNNLGEDLSKSVFKASDRVYHINCKKVNHTKSNVDLNTFNLLHKIDSFYNDTWIKYDDGGIKQIRNNMINSDPNKKTPIDDPLTVIVLPHSHSDPGWLKSLDDYFEDQTRHVLDFMLEKLTKYPDMTFVWAESVFLSLWWKELNSEDRQQVKRLVERNQLEIAVGSWVVPDEANPSLFALIDQMIEGHQWLEHNLGVKPKNTWSLDPFGYTSSLPYLYKRAGFDNMIILRVHQFLKAYLENSLNLEFSWRQSWDDYGRTEIFTTMLPYTLYNIKHQCGPDQAVCLKFDFRKIPYEYSESIAEPVTDDNVKKLSKKLVTQYRKKNELYRHNVVLVPLGDDFRYDRNVEWDQQYGNYSLLFKYINSDPELNVNIRFGTLNDYFKAVHEAIAKYNIDIPSLEGDFFPYTDRSEDYWTGYFTSRAFDKNLGREVEQYLRAAEILNVLAQTGGQGQFTEYKGHLDVLTEARQSLALFQHHDAITGTARAYVVIDYEQRLYAALKHCQSVIAQSARFLLAQSKQLEPIINFDVEQPKSMFHLRPTKSMAKMPKGTSVIVVFNPVAHRREEVIRVSIGYDNVEIIDANGNPVLSQINPLWVSAKEVYRNAFELIFIAVLEPLSLNRFRIIMKKQTEKPRENFAAFLSFGNMPTPKYADTMRFKVIPPKSETVTLQNDYIRARFSARSGFLQSVTLKSILSSTQLFLETLMYKSRRSGAYIFYPTGPCTDSEMLSTPPIRVIQGPIVSEIQIIQRDFVVTHIVRLYNCTGILGSVLEVNNLSNMTAFDDHELVMRITAPDMISKSGVFYSDLNGLQTVKRRRFKHFPRQANFYPMTSFAYIEDSVQRLSFISAQPLGVSSQEENSLEVMLDRRLLYDDMRGLGEGVRDTKVTPSQFYILLEKRSNSFDEKRGFSSPQDSERHHTIMSYPSLQAQMLAHNLQHHAIVMSIVPEDDKTPLDSVLKAMYTPLQQPLPCDVELINLRAINNPPVDHGQSRRNAFSQRDRAALVLRKYGIDCDFPVLGKQCDINQTSIVLSRLFKHAEVTQVTEMSLSLMHKLANVDLESRTELSDMEVYTFVYQFG